ncbi:MAG: lytic transglycosylase domain-containing protein, partial [Rickettsiales bacterium]|nr:lytic transglycosylase domain-containing protein [Rickettsiales bacterium]
LKFLIRSPEGKDSTDLIEAVLAIAEHTAMPGLAMNAAQYVSDYQRNDSFASPHYPVISAEPQGGWRIDQALINAVARQESRFNPHAKSGVGARGLLQIMPSTAAFIMRDASLSRKRERLYDEELNLKIGQSYIDYLLSAPGISGDLFKFLLAYNAGPGNLKRQEARMVNPENDPLFFVEGISIKESRIYIKKVMANLWIYRNRFNQDSDSLDALAAGEWPVYMAKQCDWKPRVLPFELPEEIQPDEIQSDEILPGDSVDDEGSGDADDAADRDGSGDTARLGVSNNAAGRGNGPRPGGALYDAGDGGPDA